MLLLDIQKVKEAMKTSQFQKYIGGTNVCMNVPAMDTKVCFQLTSNDTYFDDRWFSSVKDSQEAMAAGVYYYGPVKTIHKGFCLATLEKLMKYWPRESYLVMKSTTRAPGEI